MPKIVKMKELAHWAYYEPDLKKYMAFGGKPLPAEADALMREKITSDSDMREWLTGKLGVTGCGLLTRFREAPKGSVVTCTICQAEHDA